MCVLWGLCLPVNVCVLFMCLHGTHVSIYDTDGMVTRWTLMIIDSSNSKIQTCLWSPVIKPMTDMFIFVTTVSGWKHHVVVNMSLETLPCRFRRGIVFGGEV